MSTVAELAKSVQCSYDRLFQDGYLVCVHVSKWSMCTSLDKDDIAYQGDLPNLFKLGKKMLLDPKHLTTFNSLEGKARRYLEANSYDFPIADAHFVPKKKIAVVLSKLAEFKAAYAVCVREFILNYPKYKEDIAADYPELVKTFAAYYPDEEALKSKFSFTVSMYELRMPKEFGEIDIQALIARDKAEEEVKKEFQALLASQYDTALNSIQEFTTNAATVLRGQVAALCTTVIDKIKDGDVVTKKNIGALRAEIRNFRDLDFLNDSVVENELKRLETLLQAGHNFKEADAITLLNTALTTVVAKASDVSDIQGLTKEYLRAIRI